MPDNRYQVRRQIPDAKYQITFYRYQIPDAVPDSKYNKGDRYQQKNTIPPHTRNWIPNILYQILYTRYHPTDSRYQIPETIYQTRGIYQIPGTALYRIKNFRNQKPDTKYHHLPVIKYLRPDARH